MAKVTYDDCWKHGPDMHALNTLERLAAILSQCDIADNDIIQMLDQCVGECQELRTKNRGSFIRMRLRFLEGGGARGILNSIKCKMQLENVLVKCFQTLEVLCYGLPDMQDYLASEGGVDLIIESLKRFPNSAMVQQQGCLSLSTMAYKRDNVKEHVLRSGGVEVVCSTMVKFTEEAVVVQSTFECLRCLSLEFAPVQKILLDTLPIKHFIRAIKRHSLVEAVVKSGCAAITSFCNFEPIVVGTFIKEGALDLLLDALKEFPHSVKLQCRALEAIGNFYYHEETSQKIVIREVTENGSMDCVLLTLQHFPEIPEIQARGIKILASYCAKSSEMRQRVYCIGGVNLVLLAIKYHLRETETVLSCLRFLRKLLAHEQEMTIAMHVIAMEGPQIIQDVCAFYNANQECGEINQLCIQIMCLIDPIEFRSVLQDLSFDSVDEVAVAHELDVIVSVCLIQKKEIGTASCVQIYCFQKGIIDKVLSVMETFLNKEIIQMRGCNAISILCDCAIRIQHYIALKRGVQIILDAMKTHASVARVQETASTAISRLCMGALLVQRNVLDHGGTDVVLSALENFSDHYSVVAKTLRCLRDVCYRLPEAQREILAKGGVEMVMKCMRQHSRIAEIQAHGCDTLAYMCHKAPEIQLRVEECEGLDIIFQGLRSFHDNERLQEKGILGLATVCSGKKHVQELLFQKGGVDLILLALHTFPSVFKVQENGLQALRFVCFRSSDIQAYVAERQAVQLSLEGLRLHEDQDDVVIHAFGAIRILCRSTHFPTDLTTQKSIINSSLGALSKHGDNIYVANACLFMIECLCSHVAGLRTMFYQSGVINSILLVLKHQQKHASTVIAACNVLASLCFEYEPRDELVDLGGIILVQEAMENHAENYYVQSAAQKVLRVLLAHVDVR